MPETSSTPPSFEDQLKKWNWGAFILNWAWGIGNGVYIAFLMFIPGVNLVMPFVLGVKGSRWAWEKGDWKSQDDFLRTQKIWSRVGIGVLIGVPTFFGLIFLLLYALMRSSEPFILSLSAVQNNPMVIEVLGQPVVFDDWFIEGSINYTNEYGNADLTYQVSGPDGSARVHFIGRSEHDQWRTDYFSVTVLPDGPEIDLGKTRQEE